jgi:ATP-dependent DNA ligase
VRKAGLAGLLRKPSPGIALNTHYVGHGEIVYQQACELGCEGIVSKRLGSTYRSGRMLQLFLPKSVRTTAIRIACSFRISCPKTLCLHCGYGGARHSIN